MAHLLFADDSIFSCRSTSEECQKIMDILGAYEKCSGQQIKKNKTTIFFGKSTSEDRRNEIKDALGIMEIKQYEKYMGLLSFVGRKRKAALITSKRRFGRNYKGGRKNFCHRQ